MTFHGALTDIADALAAATGVPLAELQPHLYVHYEDRGIAHAFSVACGLDSMAVGEAQILGQMRAALSRAQRRGHVGPALNTLFQQALRVGKRAHTETGDRRRQRLARRGRAGRSPTRRRAGRRSATSSSSAPVAWAPSPRRP